MFTGLGFDHDLPQRGLAFGRVHEWLGLLPPVADENESASAHRKNAWSPPLTLLIHLAHAALGEADNTQLRVVWIAHSGATGSCLRPYAPALGAGSPDLGGRGRTLLSSSLFVSAASPSHRLWATDLALRSRAAIAVIADATGFDLGATRRLQLAAEASGVLCLLTRPAYEQSVLSASTTRWLVRTCPSPASSPICSPIPARRWTVSLLRCKGVQPAPGAPRLWTLERDHATRAFSVVPDLRDRSCQTPQIRLTG
ncbi:MAG: ImuA family protein [Phycisphaerales bacterium]